MIKKLLLTLLLFTPFVIYADKDPKEYVDMTPWLQELENPNEAILPEDSKITATLYDEEENIYKIDISTKTRLQTIPQTLDIGFMLDTSNSMLFPASLEKEKSNYPIYLANFANNPWYGQTIPKLDTSKTYYLIGDKTMSATVFMIYYYDNYWYAVDASKDKTEENIFKIGIETAKMTYTSDYTLYPFSADDTADTVYDLYLAGSYNVDNSVRTRLDSLQESMNRNNITMSRLLAKTTIAKDSHGEQDIRIAYNVFNGAVVDYNPHFYSLSDPNDIHINYMTGAATHTDYALGDEDLNETSNYFHQNRSAATFEWNSNHLNYGILITDGVPQALGNPIDDQTMINAAKKLTDQEVNLITVGIGLENVPRGKSLLYDISSLDANGVHNFYSIEDTDTLYNILLQIISGTIVHVNAITNIEDVIADDFYPVDKLTGKPLKANDRINLDGELVDNTFTGRVGIIAFEDNKYKVKWEQQDVPYEGWKGTFYIKAKEGIHGDDIPTNFGQVTLTSNSFSFPDEATQYELKDDYKSAINLESPKVVITIEKEETEELDLEETKKLSDIFPELATLGAVQISITDERIVKIENGTIVPLAIGQTDIEFEHDTTKYTVHVIVTHLNEPPKEKEPDNPYTGGLRSVYTFTILALSGLILILIGRNANKIKTI